jgi:lysophospholipase L1-like esterase
MPRLRIFLRRLVYWLLPLVAAIAGAAVFGYGFYSYARGDVGESVSVAPAQQKPTGTVHVINPILLGDSLARGAGDESGLGIGGRLDAQLRQRHIAAKPSVNIAVNGARTGDLIAQLASPNVQTLLAGSNCIIVSIGGNDLFGAGDWRSAPPPNPEAIMDGVLERVQQIVATIRKANPKGRIFVVGLYNPFADAPFGKVIAQFVNRWNALEIEKFESDPNLTIVQTSDIFSHHDRLSADRFHPNQEGYALIAGRIAESL